ncbi:hypothetical protein K458DRAFT_404467 [Lentithecium fluviatile CBS 122367]|uniref:Uncharacterized protein n=1 Tax=Lentithecium fluviatile CBS 122367 TaxID=1168545 RepID=A0A6G1J1V1_9PLEO|nr:hypothetical protein K458DRAFT_404467 [Lentithecium fluviatile CBS 122367]
MAGSLVAVNDISTDGRGMCRTAVQIRRDVHDAPSSIDETTARGRDQGERGREMTLPPDPGGCRSRGLAECAAGACSVQRRHGHGMGRRRRRRREWGYFAERAVDSDTLVAAHRTSTRIRHHQGSPLLRIAQSAPAPSTSYGPRAPHDAPDSHNSISLSTALAASSKPDSSPALSVRNKPITLLPLGTPVQSTIRCAVGVYTPQEPAASPLVDSPTLQRQRI